MTTPTVIMILMCITWTVSVCATISEDRHIAMIWRQLPGRSPRQLLLDICREGRYLLRYPAYPYVDLQGGVSVLPGESHTVEFDLEDGKLVRPRWVKRPVPGKAFVTLTLWHDPEQTTLIIENACSRPITMKCLQQQVRRKRLCPAEVNAVEAKGASLTGWCPKVASVLLYDFKFTDEAEDEMTKAA